MNRMPDVSRVAAAFHQKADVYDHHTLVQKRVVTNLAAAVELHLNRKPEHILDVGTGTGALLERLHARYHDAGLTGVDIAHNMCLRTQQKLGPTCSAVTGNAENLPFRDGVFDLVVSASALQWVGDLSAALREMHRVVQSGGYISLAFFCQGTLGEMQSCFREAVSHYGCRNTQHINRLHDFWSVDDVTSIVSGIDFDKSVVTVETEVDWYDNLLALLRSIKNIGAGSITGGTGNGLGWRGILQDASRLYQERYGESGRIPATYKVLYLTARKK